MADEVPEVLFVCVHNAGRSQMAAGLLERKAAGRVRVISAGSEPADQLNPAVVEAMDEIGIDISAERPKKLEDGMVRESDVVITMGCGDACPIYPGKRYEDWDLEDPSGKDLETVRRIRDEISARIDVLTNELTGRSLQLLTGRAGARPPTDGAPSHLAPSPERDHAADEEADDRRPDRELGAVLADLTLDVGHL